MPHDLSTLSYTRHVRESTIMTLECHGYRGGRAIAMLSHDQVGLSGARRLSLICIFSVQKEDNIRVLLDRARFSQVCQERALVGSLLRTAVELGDGYDGDIELLGEQLQLARHVGDF